MASLNTSSAGLAPEQNLTRYLQTIRTYPMLSAEEEFDLAKGWIAGDEASGHRLVNSYLRLVAKIAMGYRGYGLPVGELISEGNAGMMQALRRFDPDKGFRFSTYAMWWIKAAMQEYILHSWSMVKIGTTAAQKKLFFNLRKMKGQMEAFEEGDLLPEHVDQIATRLQVPEHEVVNMNRRLSAPDGSLNMPIHHDGEGEWQDWLSDEKDDQEVLLGQDEEQSDRRDLLQGAMGTLSDRERKIFKARRLEESPSTLEVLSQRYGISRERVRQIEVRAFEKVQKLVRKAVIDRQLAC